MSTPATRQSLFTIPLEILEHIAYRAGTSEFSGPPTDLISLSSSCKGLYNSLSLSGNPALYAAIFTSKFDTDAIRRRISGSDLEENDKQVTAVVLSLELRRRFETLKRLRWGDGCHAILTDCSFQEDDLWSAILMMLENDGKNAMQLAKWGNISEWLERFLYEDLGKAHVLGGPWLNRTCPNELALWLLYLCDNAGIINSSRYATTYRAFAIGANRYPITPFTWTDFRHPCIPKLSEIYETEYLGQTLYLTCPSRALPAISGYLAQFKEPTSSSTTTSTTITTTMTARTSLAANKRGSNDWDLDWERWRPMTVTDGSLGTASAISNRDVVQQYVFSNVFEGTWEGTWAGTFTYLDLDLFADILADGPSSETPSQNLGRHVWKLREYHIRASPSQASTTSSDALQLILPPGPPENAFFPSAATTRESQGEGQLIVSHDSQSFVYTRGGAEDRLKSTSQIYTWDIILIGEDHSESGETRIKGRVRARDGLITILKESERSKWLYHGYLLGGCLVGRWKDTTSLTSMVGYEGGFELRKALNG